MAISRRLLLKGIFIAPFLSVEKVAGILKGAIKPKSAARILRASGLTSLSPGIIAKEAMEQLKYNLSRGHMISQLYEAPEWGGVEIKSR